MLEDILGSPCCAVPLLAKVLWRATGVSLFQKADGVLSVGLAVGCEGIARLLSRLGLLIVVVDTLCWFRWFVSVIIDIWVGLFYKKLEFKITF